MDCQLIYENKVYIGVFLFWRVCLLYSDDSRKLTEITCLLYNSVFWLQMKMY